MGAPGVDTEARLGTCVNDGSTCFLIACSAEDGVETERDDEEELDDDDDDIIGICDVTAPFVVVFIEAVGISDKLSSFFSLLGDDIMTSEGNVFFV
jgi:hypothetical protein